MKNFDFKTFALQCKAFFMSLPIAGKIAVGVGILSLILVIFPGSKELDKMERVKSTIYEQDGVARYDNYFIKTLKKKFDLEIEQDDLQSYANSFTSPKAGDFFAVYQAKYTDGSKSDLFFIKEKAYGTYKDARGYAELVLNKIKNQARVKWFFLLLLSGGVVAFFGVPAFNAFIMRLWAKIESKIKK